MYIKTKMMNFKLTLILLYLSFTTSSQVVYTNGTETNILFLGEYNDKNELKVLLNKTIQFTSQDSLKQSYQYTQKKFLTVLDSLNLSFNCSGFEPFWDFRLKGNKAWFEGFDGKRVNFKIETYTDEFQSSSTFMFQSLNHQLVGIIINKGIKDPSKACNISTTENYAVYEVYLTYKGKMYQGCGMLSLDFEE